ncbi:hypothetical protein [uncultured Winogradskyella sp.]|uniref:hypothetical protein n=1 Tax=uncultured Winogradskyella sp. TaxID=395353 RepID=UPI0026181244|nr:hypothetical protein [uncultured Winogradskyella sp.]
MKKLITILAIAFLYVVPAQNKEVLEELSKLKQYEVELFSKLFSETNDYSEALVVINKKLASQQLEINNLKLQLQKYDLLKIELDSIKLRLKAIENNDTIVDDPVKDDPIIGPDLVIYGYGKNTVGGTGGRLIPVTNLNDSGEGSLREALESTGKRQVVFEVSGRIDIVGTTIKITDPYITILGQTAPGNGIILSRETRDRPILEIDTDEVIIQHIRFRRSTSYRSGNNQDNVWVNSGKNIVFDHCSFAWSSDGNLDLANYDGQPGRPPRIEISNVTIQNCLFTNSYGGSNKTVLVSRGATDISWFRNAWIGTAQRNPSVSTPVNEAPTWDCYYEHINNIHYDFTNGPSYTNNDPSPDAGIYHVNVINNIAIENTTSGGIVNPNVENTELKSRRWLRAKTVGNGMKIYVEGNITPYRPSESYDQWEIGQNGGGQADRNKLIPENLRSYSVNNTPIITDGIQLWEATDIWENLKTHVGASLPKRDDEDKRAVNDIDNGISTENKVSNVFPFD